MTTRTDILVIGGGIAGLSGAARLARSARVVVVEAEEHLGVHASGRSATFFHFGIGNAPVRALTAASRGFFDSPPEEVADAPLAEEWPALFVATEAMLGELDALEAAMGRFTGTVARVSEEEMKALVPVLRTGGEGVVAGLLDRSGRRLEADRLLQAFAKAVKAKGGEVRLGAGLRGLGREGGVWRAETAAGAIEAELVVNAAGAWADEVAAMAGVRPLGLIPLRRTVILFDPPGGVDAARWPFTKTAADEFYMLPQGGRLLASPVDEHPSAPCDAQPEDLDVALAAWRVEQFTTMKVERVAGRWAGLRTFAPDRVPVAGFAPDAEGFFWLAGQGGYGLQTAPAMAEAAEALLSGGQWPERLSRLGVRAEDLAPGRFAGP